MCNTRDATALLTCVIQYASAPGAALWIDLARSLCASRARNYVSTNLASTALTQRSAAAGRASVTVAALRSSAAGSTASGTRTSMQFPFRNRRLELRDLGRARRLAVEGQHVAFDRDDDAIAVLHIA